MADINTMLQEYKDLQGDRDKRIAEAKKTISEEYKVKLNELQKKMHEEVDNQVRGLS